MKLTIELPGKVFDRLMAMAIHEDRHAPQHAAHIIERYLLERDTGEKSVEPVGVGSREQGT